MGSLNRTIKLVLLLLSLALLMTVIVMLRPISVPCPNAGLTASITTKAIGGTNTHTTTDITNITKQAVAEEDQSITNVERSDIKNLGRDNDAVRCISLRTGQGGISTISNLKLEEVRKDAQQLYHDVYNDLKRYTGLSDSELLIRLARKQQFHFEGEHAWWDPSSDAELAWYYRISSSYMFGNSIHPDETKHMGLTAENEPVLDYSGGVGNNVIGLALKGIRSVYFGIGVQEFEFARFRIESRQLDHLVTFVRPFVRNQTSGQLEFDPRTAVPDMQFGTVLLFDVLEHIPNYHLTLAHLIKVLRPAGIIIEQTPFSNSRENNDIHLKASIPMKQAMVGMQLLPRNETITRKGNVWQKL